MPEAQRSIRVPAAVAPAHQLGCLVVHNLVLLVQRDLLDSEGHPREAELPGDVHPADLHVHGHDLHGAHAPARGRAL